MVRANRHNKTKFDLKLQLAHSIIQRLHASLVMGYEYQANVATASGPTLASVVDLLRSAKLCEIESQDGSKALLRWAGFPRREDWPEDIMLSYSKDSVYVVFYSGPRLQEERFLRAVQNAFDAKGLTTSFESL